MLGSSWAQGTNKSFPVCSSPACFDVFSAEFDESKLACNVSADTCQCQLKVLDLTGCVLSQVSAHEKRFDLVVSGIVDNAPASKYTADCRDVVEKHGPCKLEGITDHGFEITSTETVLTAVGVGFEMISAYQMVRVSPGGSHDFQLCTEQCKAARVAVH